MWCGDQMNDTDAGESVFLWNISTAYQIVWCHHCGQLKCHTIYTIPYLASW